MESKEQLAILREGPEKWNAWREHHPALNPDLSAEEFHNAYLEGANLTHATFAHAILFGADLSSADLSYADLSYADLDGTCLAGANLTGVSLHGASLARADLDGAVLDAAIMDMTILADVDLRLAKGLDKVTHEGPSTIGIDTLYRSHGEIPEIFLRGAGVPDSLIDYAASLTSKALDFFSCFISHSHHDQIFCDRLYADLQAKGIRTWYFPKNAVMGRSVWGEIDRSIRVYDKLVVVCSEDSLQSRPVIREIERALQREDSEGREVLFPIRIDDYLFREWQHPRKADVIEKVVGDFREHESMTAYSRELERLLRGLKASEAESL